MAIKRRELIAGAVALAGMLWAGPAAFGSEINLGRISDIRIRAARLFNSGASRILVYRRTARKFSGFIARCPSDQTNLTAANVRGARITCPTDGSVFRATNGRKVRGPATTGLEKVPIKIVDGFLVATIGAAAVLQFTKPVKASEIPVGGGDLKESTVGKLMVVQPTVGRFAAYSAICTHNQCEVSSATSRAILCACHNSEFSTATGERLAGPAREPLKKYRVVERSGMLFLA